jgi:hypothetical protein
VGDFHFDSENDAIPSELWSGKTKFPDAIKYAICQCCNRKPETTDPLPKGWLWDTLEPNNPYVWCPRMNWFLFNEPETVQEELALGNTKGVG